jgi:hypothetical protein
MEERGRKLRRPGTGREVQSWIVQAISMATHVCVIWS